MAFPRASGILMHVSSLPKAPGIGDLGRVSEQFIDFLAESGQLYWQILPLGPTGYGDSPYQCFSAFAGNPLLISPERLIEDGFLLDQSFDHLNGDDPERVDYGRVVVGKQQMLQESYAYFNQNATEDQLADFTQFCAEKSAWLDDFALFMAIKTEREQRAWWEWADDLKLRNAEALAAARARLADTLRYFQYQQWLFFRQWERVKAYAGQKGIQIIGDLPIFVARDSAEAWAKTELFYFDENANPTIVAGVPPDYFSETGQLWGNPLYRWDRMAEDGYAWWIDRFKALLELVDILRIDHFRGFAEYWAVPGGDDTAINGQWEIGPRKALFEAVLAALGKLPIMAEDLGFITPTVLELRDHFGFPGMKILQFSFTKDGEEAPTLPHHFPKNSVCYTGTHDNNTTVGWFLADASEEAKQTALEYAHTDGSNIAWDLIGIAWHCPSDTVLAPVQDLLSLGEYARMNFPGKSGGNWQWRALPESLTPTLSQQLLALTVHTGRLQTKR